MIQPKATYRKKFAKQKGICKANLRGSGGEVPQQGLGQRPKVLSLQNPRRMCPLESTRFEYPQPRLSVHSQKILLELKEGEAGEGSLEVRNTGGQVLRGVAYSKNVEFLVIGEGGFEGNNCQISFTVYPKGRAGDVCQTTIVINSNGGEAKVVVTVRIVSKATGQPHSLKSLASYAKHSPEEAVRFFVGEGFRPWLEGLGLNYDEALYDSLRLRGALGLESFMVISGIKNCQRFYSEDTECSIVEGEAREAISGELDVRKIGWGCFRLKIRSDSPWLVPNKSTITEQDFIGDRAQLGFYIYPSEIGGRRRTVVGKMFLGDSTEVAVRVRILPAFVCTLVPDSLRPGEAGKLIVRNYSGEKAVVEVKASAGFVRFDNLRTYVQDVAEIGFIIKLSPMQTAQMVLRKRPMMAAHIDVSINQANTTQRLALSVTSM